MADVRISPNTNPDELGDQVDPWDAWLNGDLATKDLPDDLQEYASEFMKS
jgi:hypothetical protein